ncbi:hypothetical protein QJS04_geneDACA013374 [Acorus gramineus]|uniref:HAT C-terminal dimerisation domain-containing protein n=1 Tax=Acorus gramineus TaxID=55184 RepID=A0AAV9A8F0_ACOGR|nr:hypothetical protein QJS04_geneDACA013374 [Acorus gramineus]
MREGLSVYIASDEQPFTFAESRRFERFQKRTRASSSTSSISLLGKEMENFDLLQWWKAHEVTFPVLSIMARDLLTPPVSTVALESSFSTSGRILSERRTRLAASSLEALICLKDWSDADETDQEFLNSLEVSCK